MRVNVRAVSVVLDRIGEQTLSTDKGSGSLPPPWAADLVR